MLVLSRKKQQSIVIGDGVELIVLKVHNNRVQIGIRADPNVPIRRVKFRRTDSAPHRGEVERSDDVVSEQPMPSMSAG